MRHKKFNWGWYIMIAAFIAAVAFVVVLEVPVSVEHVEQNIPFEAK